MLAIAYTPESECFARMPYGTRQDELDNLSTHGCCAVQMKCDDVGVPVRAKFSNDLHDVGMLPESPAALILDTQDIH